MQFESNWKSDEDDSFGMCHLPMSGPATSISFSVATSESEPSTSISRQYTQNGLGLGSDGAYSEFSGAHYSSGCMFTLFDASASVEPAWLFFNEAIPRTPTKNINGMATTDYNCTPEMNMTSMYSIGSIEPPVFFSRCTISPMIMSMATPMHSFLGSEVARSSSRRHSNENLVASSPHNGPGSLELDELNIGRHSKSPVETYHRRGTPSPGRLLVPSKMICSKIQRKTAELQRAQIWISRSASGSESESVAVDVAHRVMHKCDYPWCHEVFHLTKHLKRHKQTIHGESSKQFSCEFCGKSQFTRRDHLNNHRKRHTYHKKRVGGIEFIQAAVPIIEREEHARRHR